MLLAPRSIKGTVLKGHTRTRRLYTDIHLHIVPFNINGLADRMGLFLYMACLLNLAPVIIIKGIMGAPF